MAGRHECLAFFIFGSIVIFRIIALRNVLTADLLFRTILHDSQHERHAGCGHHPGVRIILRRVIRKVKRGDGLPGCLPCRIIEDELSYIILRVCGMRCFDELTGFAVVRAYAIGVPHERKLKVLRHFSGRGLFRAGAGSGKHSNGKHSRQSGKSTFHMFSFLSAFVLNNAWHMPFVP